MEQTGRARTGMIPFTIVIIANLISLTGTQMTRFAVVAWAWQMTGSATAAGMISICSFAATVATSAFAGVLVDRWNRKRTIIVTDVVALLATGGILALYLTGDLQVWHLGALGAIAGALESLQFPAYMAATTTMVPPEQYARANGMFQFVWQGSGTIAPVVAAGIIAAGGMTSVYVIDMISFLAVIATVAMVTIPQPPDPVEGHGSFWADLVGGFRYMWVRRSLMGLLLIVLVANISCGAYEGVFRPMVLARTGDNVSLLSQALLWAGVGGVVGGLVMSAWGGPKGRRKVAVMMGAMGVMFVTGMLLLGAGRNLLIWSVSGFSYSFFMSVLNTLLFALWQQKVEPAIQGRVFNTLRVVGLASTPIAILAATQLSDRIFEPGMAAGGSMVKLFGWLVGTGAGAGMALVLTFFALFGVLATALGFLWPAVREAETLLPDHSEAA